MIRHRPFGSGHPYSVDTEQRDPIDPVAGDPLDARRAHLTRRRSRSALELEVDGALSTIPLARAERALARPGGGWRSSRVRAGPARPRTERLDHDDHGTGRGTARAVPVPR